MREWLLLISTWLICFTCPAQAVVNKDSLQRLEAAAKTDTERVNLYIATGKQYVTTDPSTAVQYFQRAGELSKKIQYANGVMWYYAEMSDALSQKGMLDSALSINFESLEWANIFRDSTSIAKAFFNIGIAYIRLEDLENAVAYCEKGRNLFARAGNTKFEGHVDDILQSIAREMHQYRKGVTYGLRAVEKLTAIKDTSELCFAFNNLGLNYIELRQYDSANYFLEKAYKLALRLNDPTIQITYHLNSGYIHLLQRNFRQMKPFVDKALELSQKYAMPEFAAFALYGLSNYYLAEKEYATAKEYGDSAMTIANRYNMKNVKLKILPTLSNISFAMQDTKTGFSYLNQYLSLNDSVLNESVTKNTISIEKKYETGKKENQLKLQEVQLKQKNNLIYFLSAGGILLLAVFLLSYRNYKSKQKLQQIKIDELETEKQLSATEAVLKGEEQERTRLAKDLHDGLGGMLSGIKFSLSNMKENLIMTPDNALAFERSIDMLDSSIKEMRRVAHNMMPEILVRYGLDTALKEFCNEIDRSGVIHTSYQSIGMDKVELEQTVSVTIYRIVQELMSNAIKHALAKSALVQLHYSGQEKLLAVTVEDDGKGFDTAVLEQSQGIGWSNIRNRVEFLKGKIDIKSAPGKGTSALIEINM